MKKAQSSNKLLVEGKSEIHVLSALLEHHQIPETFEIRDKGGYENLRDTLDVELLGSGTLRVGIMVDADVDIANRWKALRNILLAASYQNIPVAPDPQGIILQQADMPIVGVWIMPNNTLPGALEEFVQMLIPPSDTLWERASLTVEQIPKLERPFITSHLMKAKIHTWLAWQKPPGIPMGLAITRKCLQAESPEVLPLMDWIRRLFVEQA